MHQRPALPAGFFFSMMLRLLCRVSLVLTGNGILWAKVIEGESWNWESHRALALRDYACLQRDLATLPGTMDDYG